MPVPSDVYVPRVANVRPIRPPPRLVSCFVDNVNNHEQDQWCNGNALEPEWQGDSVRLLFQTFGSSLLARTHPVGRDTKNTIPVG